MDHEDVSQLRLAAKRNVNEDLFEGRGSDADADDEAVVDEPKGVQLFDFDAYGRKIGKQKVRLRFPLPRHFQTTRRHGHLLHAGFLQYLLAIPLLFGITDAMDFC